MASTTSQPDILLFFSDQHHGQYCGYAGHAEVQTPNIDRLASEGTAFETAYTPCPLCVPARSSLLTGQFPSHNGVYGNSHIVRSDQATFLHALVAQGYETVLCGRMHFKGPDQRHGFTKRLLGDITAMYAGGVDGGDFFAETFGMKGCMDLTGAGDSPVLAYDRAVIETAAEYLRQDHSKPQCVVVGTYGPHFPYIAPLQFFEMYHGRIAAPGSWNPEGTDPNPIVEAKRQRRRISPQTGKEEDVTTETMLAARAAYFGMITEQDRHVGTVRDCWQQYLQRTGREGVFIYTSDHGDTCGEHGIFGKQTFYEGSCRIPLVFEGIGIPAGKRLAAPVSLMDVGPTICDVAGAEKPPAQDGASLQGLIGNAADKPDRTVISEWTQRFENNTVPARMIRSAQWKLMCFHHPDIPDLLFDLINDPGEMENCAEDHPDVVSKLKTMLENGWEPERVIADFEEKGEHQKLLGQWSRAASPIEAESEVWGVPEAAKKPPQLTL